MRIANLSNAALLHFRKLWRPCVIAHLAAEAIAVRVGLKSNENILQTLVKLKKGAFVDVRSLAIRHGIPARS
jgi:hypothetical protein